jgi:hypothetical protein
MSIEINDDSWIAQVSYKLPDGTLVNLRGKNRDELEEALETVRVVFPELDFGHPVVQQPVFVKPTTEAVPLTIQAQPGPVPLPASVTVPPPPPNQPSVEGRVLAIYEDPGTTNGRHWVKYTVKLEDGRRYSTFAEEIGTTLRGIRGQQVRVYLGAGKNHDNISSVEVVGNGGLV